MYDSPKTPSARPMTRNSRRCSGPLRRWPKNGPTSAPAPRAAISTPTPMSPSWNTSTPNTGINASTPAASPKPPFTEMRENTRRSRRRVVHDFDGRREHLGMLDVGLAFLGERPADAGQQKRRQQERHRVDDERDVAAEDGRDDTAHRGTDREHRAPQRAAQCVRGRQVVGLDQVRDGSRRRRVERRAEHRQHREQRVRQPHRARSDEQERGADRDARQVATHHELATIEPVDEHTGDGRRQEEGCLLRQDGQTDGDGVVGGLEDQPGDRDEQEPVAAEGDDRCDEQTPEVAVPPEEREAGAKPAGVGYSSSHWLNVAGRFSRNAGAPSMASWWKSLMAVRAAMSSPAWSNVRCAAL